MTARVADGPGGSRARSLAVSGAGALAAGVATGGFAAWAYYDDVFRPLAHTFGLWIAVLALLSAGRSARRAVVGSWLALGGAVIAFYVGKKVMYGIRYPGMPYAVSASDLVEWLALAAIAGALLGWIFSCAGRPGWSGALGTAAAAGLLVADAYRRADHHPGREAEVVIGFAAAAVVAELVRTVRSWRQGALVAVATLPCALAGLLLVSAPDALEQLLFTGGP